MSVVNCNEIRDLDFLYATGCKLAVQEETLPTSNIPMAVPGQFFKLDLKNTKSKFFSITSICQHLQTSSFHAFWLATQTWAIPCYLLKTKWL